jgi:hypothetical protein
MFVEDMKALQRSVDLVVFQKSSGCARVFGKYRINLFQNVEGAQGDVGEIADRGGDEKERNFPAAGVIHFK